MNLLIFKVLKNLRQKYNHSDDDHNQEYLHEIKDNYLEKLYELRKRKHHHIDVKGHLHKFMTAEKERLENHFEQKKRRKDEMFQKHDL